MKIVIIEDELPSYNKLLGILKSLLDDAIIEGPLTMVDEVADYLRKKHDYFPDIIIADIMLSDGLVFEGFDGVELRTPVIFTTAYDEYAINAFKYNGIDYLLKPIIKEELGKAIMRGIKRESQPKRLCDFSSMLNSTNNDYRKRFLVSQRDSFFIIETDQVSYISTADKIVMLHLIDGKEVIVDTSLDALECELDPKLFFRVSRQYIVNINAVEKLSVSFGRKLRVHIKKYPSADILVSREKSVELKNWINR